MNESQWKLTSVLTLLLFAVPMRFVWESHPALWACAMFWGGCLFGALANIRAFPRMRVGFALLAIGMFCNAVVTIANGGTMPVPGPPIHRVGSVWVEMGDHSRLIWLADFLPWRTSIGDWIMTAGAIANPITPLWRAFLDRPEAKLVLTPAASEAL